LTIDQAIQQLLQQAISHHQVGQLQDAERLYRAILQAQPNHADANHNLGVLAVQVKQPAAGLPHFKDALEANPNQEQYWLSYIDALIQSGHNDAARQALEQGRQRGLRGEVVEALAGRLLRQTTSTGSGQAQGRFEEASENEPGLREREALVALFNEGRYEEAAMGWHGRLMHGLCGCLRRICMGQMVSACLQPIRWCALSSIVHPSATSRWSVF
jgi:Tfp pilus assembly protein PilF